EIILAPLTILKLEKRDYNTVYYHTDGHFKSQVKTRYEFTYIGRKPVYYIKKPLYTKTHLINFMNISLTSNIETFTLDEKINYFVRKFVNPMSQFEVEIGGNKLTIMLKDMTVQVHMRIFMQLKIRMDMC